jgi:peroxiredoxin
VATSAQSIAEQVVVLNQDMDAHIAAEVLGRFRAEQAGLVAAAQPSAVPEPGAVMPDGELLDAHGRPTSLREASAGRAAVVVFYRGGWCPYCNLALRAYQSQLVPALTERGVTLIAISPQKPDGSLSTQETNELSFTVLSDPGNQIAASLGILTSPTDGALLSQRQLGLELAERNADGTAALPMPTTVLLDADGVIRWIDVHPDYTTRTEPWQILDAVSAAR